MSFYCKLIAAFYCFIVGANIGNASESETLLNNSDVFFEVKKSSNTLSIIGKEKGKENFSSNIDLSNFSSFVESSQNNFYMKKMEDLLSLQYHSQDGEFFEIMINKLGDIELSDSKQTNSSFDKYKTFGFKSTGSFVNRGFSRILFFRCRCQPDSQFWNDSIKWGKIHS